MQEHFLDCRGLQCPLPIVRVSLAMKSLSVSEGLRVQATNPCFPGRCGSVGQKAWLSPWPRSPFGLATCNRYMQSKMNK